MKPLRIKDIETGRKLERETIIEWLRRESQNYPASDYSGFAELIADEIETGDHLKWQSHFLQWT